MRLLDEQGPTLNTLPPDIAKGLVGKGIPSPRGGFAFQGLNLAQVVEIGSTIENLKPGLKMLGMTVNMSPKFKNYYDASYKC